MKIRAAVVHRQADRAGHELCCPSRHRDRERPVAERASRLSCGGPRLDPLFHSAIGSDPQSLQVAVTLPHRRARYRQRVHDLLDGAILLKIGASYLADSVPANHPHKPFPAHRGQGTDAHTSRQKRSELNPKIALQGGSIAREFTTRIARKRVLCPVWGSA